MCKSSGQHSFVTHSFLYTRFHVLDLGKGAERPRQPPRQPPNWLDNHVFGMQHVMYPVTAEVEKS